MKAKDYLQVYKAWTVLGNNSFQMDNGRFVVELDSDQSAVSRYQSGYLIADETGKKTELYPLLAYLGACGKIPLDPEYIDLFAGLCWRTVLDRHESSDDAAQDILAIACFDSERLMAQVKMMADDYFEQFRQLDLPILEEAV